MEKPALLEDEKWSYIAAITELWKNPFVLQTLLSLF